MIVEFDKSFEKSLNKIRDKKLFPKITKLIFVCEKAIQIKDVPNIKKLTGYSNYYRFRIGEYRIGVELQADTVIRFIVVAHRKDIYKLFP